MFPKAKKKFRVASHSIKMAVLKSKIVLFIAIFLAACAPPDTIEIPPVKTDSSELMPFGLKINGENPASNEPRPYIGCWSNGTGMISAFRQNEIFSPRAPENRSIYKEIAANESQNLYLLHLYKRYQFHIFREYTLIETGKDEFGNVTLKAKGFFSYEDLLAGNISSNFEWVKSPPKLCP